MRISRLAFAARRVALLGSSAAVALDAARRRCGRRRRSSSFGSAREALRSGVRDYNAGDKAGAAQALEYAAGAGRTRWRCGSSDACMPMATAFRTTT